MLDTLTWRDLPLLLRGDEHGLTYRLQAAKLRSAAWSVAAIALGAGLAGAAMGCWRSPEQALYSAVKLPLILFLTSLGNGALNGVLAPLLGLNIGFRQSALAILFSFAIASLILGALSPLVVFLVWNMPPMSEVQHRGAAHALMLVTQVVGVGFAGTIANWRLLAMLNRLGGRQVALRVLFAWLAGNFLLGTQLAWIGRPFFGSPDLPSQFLRSDAFHGNFFEALAHCVRVLFAN